MDGSGRGDDVGLLTQRWAARFGPDFRMQNCEVRLIPIF